MLKSYGGATCMKATAINVHAYEFFHRTSMLVNREYAQALIRATSGRTRGSHSLKSCYLI
jgi:hypothetical protein